MFRIDRTVIQNPFSALKDSLKFHGDSLLAALCLCVSESGTPVDFSGTKSALYPSEPYEDPNLQNIWSNPTSMYPYFLFPGTARPRLSSAYYEIDLDLISSIEEHQQSHHHDHQPDDNGDESSGMLKIFLYPRSASAELRRSMTAIRAFENDRWQTQWVHVKTAPRFYARPSPTNPTSFHKNSNNLNPDAPKIPSSHDRLHSSTVISTIISTSSTNEHNRQHVEGGLHRHRHQHQHDRNPSRSGAQSELPPALAPPAPSSTATSERDDGFGKSDVHRVAPRPTFEQSATYERIDETFDALEEYRLARLPVDELLELRKAFEGFIDSVNVIPNSDNSTALELMENPLIDVDHQDLHDLRQLPIPNVHHHRIHHKQKNQSHEDHEGEYQY
ncbi:hypothetical protein QAD02_006887 [Eretmocerus hayati]|uniref:Uncharacterized protein n=1 Tax=Eretmocerus hayati TaxID=131215 RepID=A0ACC2N249_9HYME|nr:hypothetical protein QAD02_006887 [Eretmocerus hayati]